MQVLQAGDGVILLRFLPDGRRLLVGVASAEKVVSFDLWSLPDGSRLRLPLPQLDLETWWYSGYGNVAAVGPDAETIYIAWGERLFSFRTVDGSPVPLPASVKANQVAISPTGDCLLAAHVTYERKELTALTLDRGKYAVAWQQEMPRPFCHVAGFLPDGECFVTIEEQVHVRRFADAAEEASARYQANRAYQPQLSPDGRHLGVIGYSSMYVYGTAALGKPRRITSTRSCGDFVSFAFHPDGRTLAVIHGGPTLVKVYDLKTLTRPKHTYKWKLGPLGCVAYSPDGTLGAAGSADGRIVIWDVDG